MKQSDLLHLCFVSLTVLVQPLGALDDIRLHGRDLVGQAVATPSECTIFTEYVANCTTKCRQCPTLALNPSDKSRAPASCQTTAGVYCFQFMAAIDCCAACQTEYDEYADCIFGSGRTIDSNECIALCSAGPGPWLLSWAMVAVILVVTSIYL